MLKMIGTVVRRPEVSHEDLCHAWEHIHGPHIVKMAAPLQYRISFFEPDDSPAHPGLDGMAELWFRDQEHFDATMTARRGPELGTDGFGNFADYTRVNWYPAFEHINIDAPTTREMTKIVYFVKRKDGITRDEFHRIWRDVHIPNVTAAVNRSPGGTRYTVSLVTSPADLQYDGLAQIWFDKPDATARDLQWTGTDAFTETAGLIQIARSHEVIILGGDAAES